MTAKKPAPPAKLDRSGAALWRQIVGVFELRPDELRLLADACHG